MRMGDDHIRRRAVSAAYSASKMPREQADAWVKSLGVELISVWFLYPGRGWYEEMHVHDETTLAETIAMTCAKIGARYALRPYYGRWELRDGNRSRYYDTREAAEMVAMHNG